MVDNLDELRHIEGFPIGEDEDLIALSDPPYYTAYPNPHIAEFVEKWGTPYDEETDDYHREPFVSDVSEGKSGAIYTAHSYHTKVPYKAITPFIEHYTLPGDVVFDGFCGSGMTGIAAQMADRRAILCDLSPAATFIAYNFNMPVDMNKFELETRRVLSEVKSECEWMYVTWYPNGEAANKVKGRVNYVVWSDVFLCPYCSHKIVFWDVAVDADTGKVKRSFLCPNCNAQVTKRDLQRATQSVYCPSMEREIKQCKQVPVLVNYSVGRKRYERKPDSYDLDLIQKIEESEIPYWYPVTRIDRDIDMWYERDYRSLGIYSIDAFFSKRNLWILAAFWNKAIGIQDQRIRSAVIFALTGMQVNLSKMNRWRANVSFPYNPLSGTLYVSSLQSEANVIVGITNKVKRLKRAWAEASNLSGSDMRVTTQSASGQLVGVKDDSVDYIFTDPPFGSNIIYSDLSIIWESWLKASTNTDYETVVHRRKKTNATTLDNYREMMRRAFEKMYRVLKPGRWITVVFHNSKAAVWNAIQEALARAGFLVAQVTVLDKQLGSYKQVIAPGAVKNDLIINAYKPRAGFIERLISKTGQGLEADFVRQHLAQLPVAANVERSKEMLYSKYLAYYVQHGYQVAYNAEQFYRAMSQWGLVELDGYWFVGEAQANEYEKRKAQTHGRSPAAQIVLFISDERSARQWLWYFLDTQKTYDEIYTAFVKALQTPEDQIPELMSILEEGFVRTDGSWKRPDTLTQAELEERRQNRLLRQFEDYLEQAKAGRRLKEVRKEALVAGFTEAYRAGRYRDILTVGRRLDKRLLESSAELFDFVDIAEAKMES